MRHLKAFHVFHVAASSASYTQAAQKLNITHGAVSKQIKVLEDYLSRPLFYRQGRNVLLTQEGELLKAYTAQAFQALDVGVTKVQQLNNQCLEVSCEPTLTMRWLMPRLADFHGETDADVRLSTAGGPVTLGMTGLSLAIRRDDFEDIHNYNKTLLVDEWVGPVFSPEYWQLVKDDWSQIKLLHSDTRPHAWDHWLTSEIQGDQFGSGHQSFAHFYFCFQAAVDGLGAALGSYPLVVDDLKRGNLVAPFGFKLSGHKYILLSENRELDELEAEFVAWLKHNLKACVPNRQS
ncbi:LysR family transcriptional regulator [Photobacterium jeanii]|uniref:LysR family transcriptional regulator n=1 Tax=Photobacterium jeanii TaxID=858640 RepID=A0A178K759_9GAMM|nr:LysR family transcriptional regulator [Photobacterium jeanii]OAN13179.1 LysR family transcriptional regulator [Photobacterium jeanii]PST89331.1 LysR family transcriptional regulator [Photobacterium jeanii]